MASKGASAQSKCPCPLCDDFVHYNSVNDGGQCEGCLIWLHFDCLGMSKDEVKRYKKLPPNHPMKLLCPTCIRDMRDMSAIKSALEDVKVQLSRMKKKTKVLSDKVKENEGNQIATSQPNTQYSQ